MVYFKASRLRSIRFMVSSILVVAALPRCATFLSEVGDPVTSVAEDHFTEPERGQLTLRDSQIREVGQIKNVPFGTSHAEPGWILPQDWHSR